MRSRLADNRGQTLLVALGIMLVLLIIVPAMVTMVMNESRWTVKNKKSTTAYYLAEAGIDRGYWKMKEDPNYWTQIASGNITGYNFDQAYSDVPSTGTASLGTYCIKLSSYSLFGMAVTNNQRVITASGRDKDKKEVRTIELIIERQPGVEAAIQAAEVKLSGGGRVHWGPMISDNEIDLSGGAVVRWPRKYARFEIKPQPPFDTSASQPNYDTDSPNPHTEFWSFNEPPGVPSFPPIDLPYYKSLAQCNTCAIAAGYDGGRYYTDTQNFSNIRDTQTYVRYGEQTIKFTGGTLVRGPVISMDDIEFSGGPASVSQANSVYSAAGLPNFYPRTVNIPSGAWQEYRKVDTAATGEYPGDLGGPGSSGLNATYTFGAASNSNIQTQDTISCSECFVYTADTWKATGGSIIVGTVQAPNDTGVNSGGTLIFYQDNLNIKTTGSTAFYRKTWHQVTPYWPGGLP